MTQRIEWIDIAKGIAIILVVLGHATGASFIGKYIYCFHMPLFFMISGLCFCKGKYCSSDFVRKRIGTILLPAIWLTILSIVILNLFGYPYVLSDLKTGLPGALWFLPVLFMVEVVYFFQARFSTKVMGGQLLLLMMISLTISNEHFYLPYSLSSLPTAIVFYGIGNVLSKDGVKKISKTVGRYKYLLCFLLLMLPFGRLLLYPEHLYLFENNIKWLDFILAPLTSLGIFLLAMIMENFPKVIKKSMIWLGNNTMMIMAIHLPVMRVMSDLRVYVNSYALFKASEEIAMWTISCCFAWFANKFCPWVIGKNHQ